MPKKIDYKKSGVNYDLLDPFKTAAQKAASKTDKNIAHFNFKTVASSRGESCFLIETKEGYLAHVEEGLGTKNLIADAMQAITKKSYYDKIAYDTVSTIVNDLITLGALPVSIAMHLAAGASEWFKDKKKTNDLISGWAKACKDSGAVWSGGETPTLKGIIDPKTVLLGGSAIGIIQKKSQLIKGDIRNNDAIILLESSGIHTNGATLAREIAAKLPAGYKTKTSGGRMFGEALLAPSIIYVPVIRDCLKANIRLHYAVHITGHGWRKLMRLKKPFVYTIEKLLPPKPIFGFIQKYSGLSEKEMYATFNMGAGFAIFAAKKDAARIINICRKHKIKAIKAGQVKKKGNQKKVIIKPLNIEFPAESLAVR
ncbi:MAG: AIR synthase-related protein [Candidatus Gracilibacteria bacterium]